MEGRKGVGYCRCRVFSISNMSNFTAGTPSECNQAFSYTYCIIVLIVFGLIWLLGY